VIFGGMLSEKTIGPCVARGQSSGTGSPTTGLEAKTALGAAEAPALAGIDARD
jgi:hypothetical protein